MPARTAVDQVRFDPLETAEVLVGRKLRELRLQRGLSLRALADRSGLNVNTLSLVENGKTSPSVSTLQQLAFALQVPIVAFFESSPLEKQVVYTPAEERSGAPLSSTQMQNLAQGLAGSSLQPFAVTMKPKTGSGDRMIVHTGYEFVYCLAGKVRYHIEDQDYLLGAGDSLVFEAHLPHCWENAGDEIAQMLLVLVPADERERPIQRHFSNLIQQELNMKIAVITEDGKSISQHFGRAPYYLVLTVEGGKIVHREMRPKMGHNQFSSQPHAAESEGSGHGMDAASHDKHVNMAQTIADCQVLLCGGMGMGAYNSMRRLNIQPLVTEERDIEAAVQAYIEGKLVDQTELLH